MSNSAHNGPTANTAAELSPRWQAWRERLPLDEYEERFAKLEAEGNNVHGEVDALERLRSRLGQLTEQDRGAADQQITDGQITDDGHRKPAVLDAGCGTGRASVELNQRGWSVTAVDYDPDMIALARPKSDEISWHHGSLVDIQLGQAFDAILMAGNILLFVHEGTEPAILANMADHLVTDGLLIAGFGLRSFDIKTYEQWCTDAGLELVQHYRTWDEVAASSPDPLSADSLSTDPRSSGQTSAAQFDSAQTSAANTSAAPFGAADESYVVALHRKLKKT